jgi:hypothetical protein
LHVEEEEIRGMLFDEIDGFEAVFALGEEINFGKGFEEEGQLFASGLFVVDDDGVDGHGGDQVEYRRGAVRMAIEGRSDQRPEISDQEARGGRVKEYKSIRVEESKKHHKDNAETQRTLRKRREKQERRTDG